MHDVINLVRDRALRPARTRTVSLLTLNLGLSAIRLGRRIAIAAHVEERLTFAPALIAALDADVIALQEIYNGRDQRFLAQALRRTYPFALSASAHGSMFGNGLMLLSRLPIRRGWFAPFRAAAPASRWLWEQGFLACELGRPKTRPLRLINAHLVASEPWHRPDDAVTQARRTRETRALLDLAGEQSALLVGDFNTSPTVAPAIYQSIIAAGYRDAFAHIHGTVEEPTWDADNPLNRSAPHRQAPSQRIDHVFVPTSTGAGIRPMAAQTVLKEPLVPLRNGNTCTLSDHYGLLVTLSITS
jgi:endonuclease/exonuclease/phosphatase family metal-dependent hydrolase